VLSSVRMNSVHEFLTEMLIDETLHLDGFQVKKIVWAIFDIKDPPWTLAEMKNLTYIIVKF
jgi:hypothetical protein